MPIAQIGHELETLGLSGRNVRCLLLLPQVYVGWASARREPPALEALLDTSTRRGNFESGSVDAARGWLFEQPTRAQFQSGFALLRVLRKMPDSSIRSSDVLESMIWAARVAALDREPSAPGRGGRVTAAARRAMFDLEAWLEVDVFGLWSDSFEAFDDEFLSPRTPEGVVTAPPEARRFQGSSSGIQRRTAPAVAAVPGSAASVALLRRQVSR